MEKQYEKKITWTIKNFSSLQSERVYSDPFVVGDSKWRLVVFPKGNGVGINKCLSVFLNVADSGSLPYGWKRHAKFSLAVVNHISEELTIMEAKHWFNQNFPTLGSQEMLPLTKLVYKNDGFLVNGEVKIVADVSVLEVVVKSHVLKGTTLVNESINFNGFQVLPSQVELVNKLFTEHPDIASKIRLENQHLRTTYLNCLLSLTEILCQSPEKVSNDDLTKTYSTLSYVTKAGFKLDWLEKKLREVGETRVQEIEEALKNMKQKCEDMEALLEFLR